MTVCGKSALLCATWLALGSAAAFADELGARCTVRVIHALESETDAAAPAGKAPNPKAQKIDPKIVRLRPYLSRPPFTSWHEFVMLEEKALELTPKAPQGFALPNGKQATLTYLEHLPAAAGKHRVRLQLQLGDPQKPSLNTIFVVDEGGVVLQAGQRYKQGLLVLGTSCDEAHAR